VSGVFVAPPVPAGHRYEDMELSFYCRVGMAKPPVRPSLLRGLKRFVSSWLIHNTEPLTVSDGLVRQCAGVHPDDPLDFDQYLLDTNFPLWRKEQLRQAYDSACSRVPHTDLQRQAKRFGLPVVREAEHSRDTLCHSFPKQEFMHKLRKSKRTINPRPDAFKVLIGPLVHFYEKFVYKVQHNGFPLGIKCVPVSERPALLLKLEELVGPSSVVFATDHTAWEAHVSPEIMNAVELQIFSFLAKHNAKARVIVEYMRKVTSRRNFGENGHFVTEVKGARQSGDMHTSLGNSVTNFLVMAYACHLAHCHFTGMVEGDDGIFVVEPSPSGQVPGVSDFADLGFDVKLETPPTVHEAQFCGNVFDPSDCRNLCDPIWFLSKSAWLLGNYQHLSLRTKLELLKARAMSALAEYAGCPIVHVWAVKVLELTAHVGYRLDFPGMDSYWTHVVLDPYLGDLTNCIRDFAKVAIGEKSRSLLEATWGIPVGVQKAIETQLGLMTLAKGIDVTRFSQYVNADYLAYSRSNVVVA